MSNLLYKIFDEVKNKKAMGVPIVELNVGEPDQEPPRGVMEFISQQLLKEKIKYCSAAGLFELRKVISLKHGVDPENVIIGPGSKFLIFAFLKTLLTKNDDEVIIPVPVWGTYCSMIKTISFGKIKCLKTSFEDGWQIDVKKLKKLLSKKTKLMIICDPNNPTSTTLRTAIKNEIIELADKNNVNLLIDNAYDSLTFNRQKGERLLIEDKTIRIFSFSKTFAMTGFRLGYAIADKQLIDKIVQFNQITITCVPEFIQKAGLMVLKHENRFTQELVTIYHERAQIAEKILKKSGIDFIRPNAGFYIFIKLTNRNAESFSFQLLNKGVAVVPGTAFGPFPNFVRVSLTAADSELIKGLNLIVNEYKKIGAQND